MNGVTFTVYLLATFVIAFSCTGILVLMFMSFPFSFLFFFQALASSSLQDTRRWNWPPPWRRRGALTRRIQKKKRRIRRRSGRRRGNATSASVRVGVLFMRPPCTAGSHMERSVSKKNKKTKKNVSQRGIIFSPRVHVYPPSTTTSNNPIS